MNIKSRGKKITDLKTLFKLACVDVYLLFTY